MSRFLALSFALVLFGVLNARGHTCATFERTEESEYRKELDKIGAIFEGEVISIGETTSSYDASFPFQLVTFRVLRTWRGVESPEITIRYFRAYDPFEREIGGIGTRKLIFGHLAADGLPSVSFCNFDTQFGKERMKSVLGEGTVVEQPSAIEPENTSEPWWVRLWNWVVSFF